MCVFPERLVKEEPEQHGVLLESRLPIGRPLLPTELHISGEVKLIQSVSTRHKELYLYLSANVRFR